MQEKLLSIICLSAMTIQLLELEADSVMLFKLSHSWCALMQIPEYLY